MDRRRMDDAEGGRVVHRGRRVRKLAVVVALQNLLVVACLLLTLYVYRDVHKDDHWHFEDNAHIQFSPLADISGNKTLQFSSIHSKYRMNLTNKTNDTIDVPCTGPYVLYMDMCYRSLNNPESRGELQLTVGNNILVSSVRLNGSDKVCEGLQSTAYLRASEKARLRLFSFNSFKIKKVTVGLSYLLGSRCEF